MAASISSRGQVRAARLASAAVVVVAMGARYPTLAAGAGGSPRSEVLRIAAAPPADGAVETLGSFTDSLGFHRTYVLVDRGLTDEQLIRLAKRLHADEPETWFWLFDDKSQFPAFMTALPKTAHGDLDGYPLDWVQAHTVGHIVLQLVPHAPKRWALVKGGGSDVLQVLGDH